MAPDANGLRYNRGVPDFNDPSTPMFVAAVALHELFNTLISVGFSQEQAIMLCATLMERTAYAN